LVHKYERAEPRARIEGADEKDGNAASLNTPPNLGLQFAIAAWRGESI
jgi:hypothetical protein